MKNIDRPTLILAFVLAIFLWMYVRVSQETPTESRLIYGVPVQLEGKIPGIKTSLHPDTRMVDITITGRPKAVYGVSPRQIKVKVDVSGIKVINKPQPLPTVVTLPNTVELDGKPPVVIISTEVLEQKSFPVRVLFIPPPEAGRETGEYLTQPADVPVEATAETLKRVRYVLVTVNPNEPIAGGVKIPPRAVDENGDRVEDANVLQESILVRQGSGLGPRGTRKVAVRVPDFRQPRRYIVSVGKIRPDQVTLTGDPALLAKQSAFLETYPIDVSHLTKDMTMTVPLRVQPGLTVAEGTTVRVDLEVQPVQP
ncbi:MAG: CdaR family protein [Armatimonadota bacterium]